MNYLKELLNSMLYNVASRVREEIKPLKHNKINQIFLSLGNKQTKALYLLKFNSIFWYYFDTISILSFERYYRYRLESRTDSQKNPLFYNYKSIKLPRVKSLSALKVNWNCVWIFVLNISSRQCWKIVLIAYWKTCSNLPSSEDTI